MSSFDDHNQRWDDRHSSINAGDPAYGGLSLSEVISTPWLAKAYGLALSEDNDIEYFYASRLRGEPEEGVEDIHFHPTEPRMFRVRFTYRF